MPTPVNPAPADPPDPEPASERAARDVLLDGTADDLVRETLDAPLAQALIAAGEGRLPEAATGLRQAIGPFPADMAARHADLLDVIDGILRMYHGRYAAGLRDSTEPLARLQAGPCAPWLAFAHSALGLALGRLGDPAAGLPWVAHAESLAIAARQPRGLLRVRSDAGSLHALLDNHSQAIEALAEAATLAEKTAPRFVQAGCLNDLAMAWLQRAQWLARREDGEGVIEAATEADRYAGRALQAAWAGEVGPAQAMALCVRGRARLLLGRLADAETDLEAAAPSAGGHTQVQVELHRGWAAMRCAQQRLGEARIALRRALEMATGEGYASVRMRLLGDAMELELRDGRAARALKRRIEQLESEHVLRRNRDRLARAETLFDPTSGLRWPLAASEAFAEEDSEGPWRDPGTGLLGASGMERVLSASMAESAVVALALLDIQPAPADLQLPLRMGAVLAELWHPGFVAARMPGGKVMLLFVNRPFAQVQAECASLRAALQARLGVPAESQLRLGLVARSGHASPGMLVREAAAALMSAQQEPPPKPMPATGASASSSTERAAESALGAVPVLPSVPPEAEPAGRADARSSRHLRTGRHGPRTDARHGPGRPSGVPRSRH